MSDLLTLRDEVLGWLGGMVGVDTIEGGPDADLLTDDDGQLRPAVVLWMGAGTHPVTRVSGHPGMRVDGFTVVCVGPHVDGCLYAVGQVRLALQSRRPTSRSGTVTEEPYFGQYPLAEPGTSPLRVQLPLQYTIG